MRALIEKGSFAAGAPCEAGAVYRGGEGGIDGVRRLGMPEILRRNASRPGEQRLASAPITPSAGRALCAARAGRVEPLRRPLRRLAPG